MPKRKKSKFAIDNKNIMAVFLQKDNPEIDLSQLSEGSHKKIVCLCPICKTKWICEIRDNKDKIACPHCAQEKRMLSNIETKTNIQNSLQTLYPEIAAQWDYERNGGIFTPSNIAAKSNKKFFWKCPLGHIYEATVTNRTQHNSGCPYCSGQKVMVGFNDLATTNPELAQEWSQQNEIPPTAITAHSNRKVYWKCILGHDDYLMSVKQRSNNQGCPVCAAQSQTSFPEQAILFYIKKIYPDAVSRWKLQNHEIDIYIPSLKTGIEYNGSYYHRNKHKKDLEKKRFFQSQNIKLLVVNEYKNHEDCQDADFFLNERYKPKDLNYLIQVILNYFTNSIDFQVDTQRDSLKIKEQYIFQIVQNSIAELKPEIAREWDKEKNGRISPYMVSWGSKQKFYWKCPKCQHSYLASSKDRFHGSGCPYCFSLHKCQNLVPGLNDMASVYPAMLDRWDYEKNKCLPSHALATGSQKYYWKCHKGHSYISSVQAERTRKICPICSGKMVVPGVNDLISQNKKASDFWDYELNNVDPHNIYCKNQSLAVHWKCKKCGFSWTATAREFHRCPHCAKIHAQLNVYLYPSLSFYGHFENAEEFCKHIGLNIKQQRGNISSVCTRKQHTLLHKYIIRHPDDDEFQPSEIVSK